ncbi:hypothetical protein HDU77_001516 [Chytriomyces hyalinus]|nr:hypothetical protein HDU77_001516 [Chytriomyces hyalinus]
MAVIVGAGPAAAAAGAIGAGSELLAGGALAGAGLSASTAATAAGAVGGAVGAVASGTGVVAGAGIGAVAAGAGGATMGAVGGAAGLIGGTATAGSITGVGSAASAFAVGTVGSSLSTGLGAAFVAAGPAGWVAGAALVACGSLIVGASTDEGVLVDWSCWQKCLCCPGVVDGLAAHGHQGIPLAQLLQASCIQSDSCDSNNRAVIRNHSGQMFGLKYVSNPLNGTLIGLHLEEIF